MKQKLAFRAWYYFRTGYAVYLGTSLSIVNTMILIYYLAGDKEKLGIIQTIFPNFSDFIIFAVGIGVPIMILIGYSHFKRTKAYGEEAVIATESNPFVYKIVPKSKEEMALQLAMYQFRVSKFMIEKLASDNPDDPEAKKLLGELQEWEKKYTKLLNFENTKKILDE